MNPGIYRRRICIATSENEARADMEDDLHRFAVIIRHDGAHVTAIQGLPIRVPWSLCPHSVEALGRLIGMPLSPHPLAVFQHADCSQQCTHMFDLAGLAIAHAARGTRLRQYDVEAPYLEEKGARSLSLRRDGREILNWTIDGATLLAPEAFTGHDIKRLPAWAESAFPDPDDYEAIVILRRSVLISKARLHDWDIFSTAAATGHGLGACYVFQPGIQERAIRMVGTAREFTDTPGRMLSDLQP
ncbi:MAG: DUF2889 domain-containing protein [Glaciimonas sp.]|nr:DUF2889 domain-containing protein [Glaciimonas sp.]